ncbi:MAG: hypothetical protein A3C58_00985 [Candidatus Staskawiczbacteria bacterium RIFCSPHIGHO2_02_FULL_34_10]|uniref:Uncharacterized protein n=1 Tax=Candidatus Staskawiczbacteria bacterium RIFCSPHIGHO2_02_FULL_34_10 TaxID=1802205 RepID=A0A1G2HYS4_9BACT|nr:MAG: hypothetical protein A3C58_00985 [Candidatus Staskawiczbacteria bacterium RIFCSPHIGHO2_02_FULL_34_10]
MENQNQYEELITEVIEKQSIILGPDIAILKARNVSELVIDDQGKVTEIKGDKKAALQKIINVYVELSGMIVKNALSSIFEKYPDVEKINL